jgi:tRNA(Ile2) C34 agmatinyltransferase TiaS
MSKRRILHNRVRCLACGQTVESLSRHDFRWCPCGTIAVDGGSEYLRRVGNLDKYEELSEETDDPPPV